MSNGHLDDEYPKSLTRGSSTVCSGPKDPGKQTSYEQVESGDTTAITVSKARRELSRLIERVNLDRTEIEIVSKRGSAVLMSKDEYDALVETSYLLSSPTNASRLMSALRSVRQSKP